tara:strand:+ start:595 stop:762 length:168 start_codon:yes stop_codon:yes gene_type:complete
MMMMEKTKKKKEKKKKKKKKKEAKEHLHAKIHARLQRGAPEIVLNETESKKANVQ